MLVAVAQARNLEIMTKVVDDSIAKSAELRRKRQEEDEVRRREEARKQRIEETERIEREHAKEAAHRQREDEVRQEALDIARREQMQRQIARTTATDGPFDQVA